MKVANNVLELIGQTPILKLNNMIEAGKGQVYVKLEAFNPGGSIKDRPGLYMIEKAEAEGKISRDSIIVEATSGNTGIGLAIAAVMKGYPLFIVMPENMSEERKKILRFYGAKLILTPAEKGMAGAVARAEEMAHENEKYFLVKQFENIANAESHMRTTAREIVEQMDGDLDALVCGIGSGGTITGLGTTLKEEIPGITIAGIEPSNSAVLNGKSPGSHKIQGIGAGFVPPVLNTNIVDQIICVNDEDALQTCRIAARKEGLFLGISSGAAIYAALEIAREMESSRRILAIAPDGADKYMSTELFDIREVK